MGFDSGTGPPFYSCGFAVLFLLGGGLLFGLFLLLCIYLIVVFIPVFAIFFVLGGRTYIWSVLGMGVRWTSLRAWTQQGQWTSSGGFTWGWRTPAERGSGATLRVGAEGGAAGGPVRAASTSTVYKSGRL